MAVIDSVCKNEYNWLAGKLAGTVKHIKISGCVNFRLISKKRQGRYSDSHHKHLSGGTFHLSHQGSVVLHINLVN